MNRLRRLLALLLAMSLCAAMAFATGTETEDGAAPEEGFLSEYERQITRAEFCTLIVPVLARLQDTTVEEMYNKLTDRQKNESFGDVGENAKYIAIAKKYELVEGTDEYQFSPIAEIKRQEAATIILNLVRKAAPEYYDEELDYGAEITIEDHVEIAGWAKEGVNYAVYTGLMELDRNGNFDPTASLTVGDAVMLIADISNYLNTPLPEEPVEEEEEEPEEEEEKIPGYVWIIVASAAVVVLTVVIVAVAVSSRRKKEAKRRTESRLEQELDRRLSVTERSVAPAAPQRIYRQDAVPQQTPNVNISIPAAAGSAQPIRPVAPAKSAPIVPPSAGAGGTVFVGAVQFPQIRLQGIQGVDLDRVFALDKPLTIGRGDDNVLQLTNGTISRNHCRISWDGTKIIAEDSGARNPVKVLRGDKEFTILKDARTPMRDGDILLLGGLRIRVKL